MLAQLNLSVGVDHTNDKHTIDMLSLHLAHYLALQIDLEPCNYLSSPPQHSLLAVQNLHGNSASDENYYSLEEVIVDSVVTVANYTH